MADWHGYPQHPDAHPERPWWRLVRVSSMLDELRWQRTDGARVLYMVPDEVLVERDAAHPLPPPEPRCGQVWVRRSDGLAALVIEVEQGENEWAVAIGCRRQVRVGRDQWPPLDCVLAAGPGAPWAPMGVKHG